MTIEHKSEERKKPNRAFWGASSIAIAEHEEFIHDRLKKSWSLRLIWSHLQENNGISVSYNTFRTAMARISKKSSSKNEEKGKIAESPRPRAKENTTRYVEPEPEHKPNQIRKPRYAEASVEGVKFNYE